MIEIVLEWADSDSGSETAIVDEDWEAISERNGQRVIPAITTAEHGDVGR
jgi:hypothetical protein